MNSMANTSDTLTYFMNVSYDNKVIKSDLASYINYSTI